MERLFTIVFSACLSLGGLFAQTSDIVIFSDSGEKFTLSIDGEVKNATPATRVVATGIRNASPMLLVNFSDAGIAPIKQTGMMEPGQEYTLRISTNKKGARVMRLQGQASLGTAATATQDKPSPTNFTDDNPATGSNPETTTTGGTGMQSSTTITTTDGQNANVNMGVNGVNVAMSVNGMGGTTTTTTTTQTSIGMNEYPNVPVEVVPAVCAHAMEAKEFNDAKASIAGKGFEDTKLTLAKQVSGANCLTADQVKEIMGLFGFEASKLDFAKFAYDHTVDVNNYYKVNDAFGFSSSVDELNSYIQGR